MAKMTSGQTSRSKAVGQVRAEDVFITGRPSALAESVVENAEQLSGALGERVGEYQVAGRSAPVEDVHANFLRGAFARIFTPARCNARSTAP